MSHCHCSRGLRVAGPHGSSGKHSKSSSIKKSNLPAHSLRTIEVIRLSRFGKNKLITNPFLSGKFVKRGNNYLTGGSPWFSWTQAVSALDRQDVARAGQFPRMISSHNIYTHDRLTCLKKQIRVDYSKMYKAFLKNHSRTKYQVEKSSPTRSQLLHSFCAGVSLISGPNPILLCLGFVFGFFWWRWFFLRKGVQFRAFWSVWWTWISPSVWGRAGIRNLIRSWGPWVPVWLKWAFFLFWETWVQIFSLSLYRVVSGTLVYPFILFSNIYKSQ